MIVAGLLLAAGQSTRFGQANKLLATFNGKPMVRHAAEALKATECAHFIAVTADDDVAAILPEFQIAPIREPEAQQSDSLRAGVAKAKALGAQGVLVCLGDMPLVSADTCGRVLATGLRLGQAATTDGIRRTPPAFFGPDTLAMLSDAQGDQGARSLLRQFSNDVLVHVPKEELTDIDTEYDLTQAEKSNGFGAA